MILGINAHLYTQIHVALSLIGIATGLIAAFGMIGGRLLPRTTALFILTTVLTSVTGILFPWKGFTPGVILGILSLIVLVPAIIARYSKHLTGGWRRTYVITAMIALWFNCFVLIAQLFEHVPKLHALAPTGTEPPFKIAQLIQLIIFIVLTFAADRGFRFGSRNATA
jgi:hypothetical protein